MAGQDDYNEYDLEPVEYCARCYSLKIKYEEIIDSACCMECGCSDTLTSSIGEWEELYNKRYGHKYIQKAYDPRKSPIFKLSIDKLKTKLYENPDWEKIVQSLYPNFPKGLGKADTIIFLFDKLIRDNRLDDLKLSLVNNIKEKRYGRKKNGPEGQKGED